MVLVGSSFGSSGIFWCFVRVWLSVILYSAGLLSVIGMEEFAGQADRAVRAGATLLYLATMHGAPVWRVCVIWRSPNASVQ